MNILVKKNKNKYIFYIKEISLIHSSTSLTRGYKEIESKRDEILNQIKDHNLGDPSNNSDFEINFSKNIKNFILKSLIITGCVAFILIYSITKSFEGIHTSIDKIKIKTGKEFWGPLRENIISLADEDNEIDQETQTEILKSIKIVVDRYKPFINEFKKINTAD